MKKPPTWMSDDLVFLDERCPLPLDAPFTSDQAQALGVSRWYQRILLDRGLIRPVLRGTFVAAQVVDSVDVRAASLRLVVPATGVVTDETAAWLHGVDVLPPSALYTPPPLRVFSTGGSRLRRPEVASGTDSCPRRTSPRSSVCESPLRYARRSTSGEGCGASPPWPRSTASCASGSPGRPPSVGRTLSRRARRRAATLAGSAGRWSRRVAWESWLRLHWYDAGLPRPELQVWVHDDHGVPRYRLDIALPECKFAAEYDGKEFHSTDEQRLNDRQRRSWLDTEGRWVIEVFEQEDVYPREADPTARLREGAEMARTRSGLWVPESVRRQAAG